jgi:transcriptional regulator with XRE-family HTH domain
MDKTIHSAEYAIFLKVFRDVRRKSGLTQIDLAGKIGESQSFVSKCERGERRIDLIELRAFCDAFGVTLREFISQFEKMIGKQRASTT